MLGRTCRTVAWAAAALVAAVGVIALPGVVLSAAVVAAVLVGPAAATISGRSELPAGRIVRNAAMAAAVTVAASATVAGLAVLIGSATAFVLAILLVGAGAWGWVRVPDLRDGWRVLLAGGSPRQVPADPGRGAGTGGDVRRSHARHAAVVSQQAVSGQLSPAADVPLVVDPSMSTMQLCGAWQRSYWQLRDLPAGPGQLRVVRYRRNLLDELQRRDPAGFDRWLRTAPRAGAHPGRYLLADR